MQLLQLSIVFFSDHESWSFVCVCVWVPPVRRTHDSLHILDNMNNYLDNFMQLLPLSSVVFSNHGRWFHSKPCANIVLKGGVSELLCELVQSCHCEKISRGGVSVSEEPFRLFYFPYPFQTIPDPFQSLNTKGSIFKVSLQTYIYIIVIYTTTNKFVWTRMLIFLSN
ncbi:unnamed protein product [Malus baccata var. baccata]